MFHDTHMHKWHSPVRCHAVIGTWAAAAGQTANTIVYKKSAANETSVLTIPIELPMNDGPDKGAALVSIDIFWELLTAAVTSVTAAVYKVTLPVNGAAIGTAESLYFGYDLAHDTAGERLTQDQHTMNLAFVTPIWVEEDHVIQVQLTIVCGAGGGVFDYIGTRANYTYRL